MNGKNKCKDCGAPLGETENTPKLLCDTCGPLRVVKENWQPISTGGSIQRVFQVPDYGDAPRKEPRKWPT